MAFPETVSTLEPIGPVITNMSQPTLTVFRPDPANRTRTAVIIAPGGAFHFLSMEAEGTKIGEWFRSRGITAFVLKYRVLQTTPDHMDPKPSSAKQ